MGNKDKDRGRVKNNTKLIKKKQEKKDLYWPWKVSQGIRHPDACLENYGNSCTKTEAISVRIDYLFRYIIGK